MCPECEARRKLARDALVKAKIGEALGHVVKGVAEMAGVKEKSGTQQLQAKKVDQEIPRNKPQ